MPDRRSTTLAATAGLTAGVVLAMAPWASAGHGNDVLEADLVGRAEVRTGATDSRIAGDPNGRGEVYVFGIDGDATTLCYVLLVEGIDGLDLAPGGNRMAHIHEGAPGENGPVEVTLAFPQGGQAADCLTEGEAGKGLTAGEVAEILAHPGEYDVNVHNDEFPGGAVRGQLGPQG